MGLRGVVLGGLEAFFVWARVSGRESLLCIFLKSRPGQERRGEGWCDWGSCLICCRKFARGARLKELAIFESRCRRKCGQKVVFLLLWCSGCNAMRV